MTVVRIASGLFVGLVTGIAGLVVSRHQLFLARVSWPWGLVLTLVAVPLVLTGVGRLGSQVAAWAAAAGWFLPVAVLALVHPGGDQIPGQDTTGLAYLILGLIGVVAAVVLTPSERALSPTEQAASPPRSGSARPAPPRRR
jgi:Family of unknown function (DUF6113)